MNHDFQTRIKIFIRGASYLSYVCVNRRIFVNALQSYVCERLTFYANESR